MHIHTRARLLLRGLVPLLAIAVAACERPSEPEGVEGRYTVRTVNGSPPPAAVHAQLQVVDARLNLEDDGTASVQLSTRFVAADGTAEPVTHTTYTGTYQVNGQELVLGWLSDGNRAVRAEGVVVSAREVAVTLHIPGPASQGFFTFPVALVLRR